MTPQPDHCACGKPIPRAAHGKRKWCSKRCRCQHYYRRKKKSPAWQAKTAARLTYARAHGRAYRQRPEVRRRNVQRSQRWQQTPQGRQYVIAFRRSYRSRRRSLVALALVWHLERLAQNIEVIMNAVETAGLADVASMSTEDLKAELVAGLRIAREQLLRLGAVLLELDRRGEHVNGDAHLLGLLRSIGRGELLADVVVRFGGSPATLSKAARLPLEQQAQLLDQDDETVERRFRPRKRQSDPHPSKGLPALGAMAAQGTIKDVVSMCVMLVENSRDPVAVASLLAQRLERIRSVGA